ncbi:glutaminyl-peptide cyclotransferase [Corynebacterium sp. CCUG 65737]|uniref:glutaminyl-peptide cyclotransferase n=1 Tax=Corynebacterium sp. CCUG 65737 TaxID=2823889 RepID=UPI00210904DC|nr:glutaminyl-peptide cyclotransferase [Corynebacterium sp. CCUG 65737]MCQ4627339.1 glutaminyl-peptide cyclotransferase [Corynebacterium sp. CCUG 65737]
MVHSPNRVRLPQIAMSAVTAVSIIGLTACAPSSSEGSSEQQDSSQVEQLTVDVLERYDFDESSFTQGLEVAPDGTLYVATGQEGESRIYRSTIEGEELASQDLDREFFGEGITQVDDHLWQLTWQNEVAIKRDADTLDEIDRVNYDGEGWGICHRDDGGEVIFSDGSDQLRRIDPDTFAERERFTVTMDEQPIEGLNELECVGDDIYANIFMTTDIVRINADTGAVEALIDASPLQNNATPDPNHVLNGIAYLPNTSGAGQEFLLSGKRWPDLYRVKFVPQ